MAGSEKALLPDGRVPGAIGVSDLKRRVVSHAKAYAAKVILIEDAGIGTGLIQQLRSEGALRPIPIRPDASKTDRVAAQSAILESGRVFVPKSALWLDAYRTELLAFPAGRNDDQVDSTSQMLNWFEGRRARVGCFEGRGFARETCARKTPNDAVPAHPVVCERSNAGG